MPLSLGLREALGETFGVSVTGVMSSSAIEGSAARHKETRPAPLGQAHEAETAVGEITKFRATNNIADGTANIA